MTKFKNVLTFPFVLIAHAARWGCMLVVIAGLILWNRILKDIE